MKYFATVSNFLRSQNSLFKEKKRTTTIKRNGKNLSLSISLSLEEGKGHVYKSYQGFKSLS